MKLRKESQEIILSPMNKAFKKFHSESQSPLSFAVVFSAIHRTLGALLLFLILQVVPLAQLF